MSTGEPARTRGAICRADLMRLLAVAPRDALMLDADASGWFGYVRGPIRTEAIIPETPARAAPVRERKLPPSLPFVHAIVRREPRQHPKPDTATEEAFTHTAPIDEEAGRAPSNNRLIAYEDLVPQARLLPVLRRLLGASRTGPLDVERLTQLLATSRLPRDLPRHIYRRWHPDLVVLLDFCPRLWPYRWDMHQLADRLLRHVGRSGVSLRIINHGPFGPWSNWLAHQNRQSAAEPAELPWRMPRAETPLLIVSDLGLLLGPQSAPARAWAQFIRELFHAQVRPVALVQLGASQLGEPVPPSLPVLRWSPDARPKPTRVHGTAVPQPDSLDDLIAMIAATRRVDPLLLRAMRRLNPREPLNAGLEGALWCHADVDAVYTASIRTEARELYLRHFAERLTSLHAKLDQQRSRHHGHLRAALNHEETLLWAAQVGGEAVAQSPGAATRIENAREFMRRLAATLTHRGVQPSLSWWSVAQGIVRRADERMWKRYALELHRLLAPQLRAQGAAVSIPEHADPAVLAGLLGRDQPAVPCWLVRDTLSGWLLLQTEAAGARQSPLGEPLLLDAGGVRVSVAEAGPARWLTASTLPARLIRLSEPAKLHIETARESILVAAVGRRARKDTASKEGLQARVEAARAQLRARLADWDDETRESYIARGYSDYWLAFNTDEHLRHFELMRYTDATRKSLCVETRPHPSRDVTEVTIYGPDHPGLLAQIAGAMSLSGTSIVDAKVVTLANYMVLGVFHIQDLAGKPFDNDDRLRQLAARVEAAMVGNIQPGRELQDMRPRALPSRRRAFKVPRVIFDNEASTSHSVIKITGRDRPGFLYDVTSTMTAQGLQIASAHIFTYGERVVDVFNVKDVFGLKIEQPRLQRIEKPLLEAIESGDSEAIESGDLTCPICGKSGLTKRGLELHMVRLHKAERDKGKEEVA